MKRSWKLILIVAIVAFMSSSCCSAGSLERIARHAVTGSPTGSWTGGTIPPPHAGSFGVQNQSPAVWTECFLFTDCFNRKSIFTYNQARQVVFVKRPLKYFCLPPPPPIKTKSNMNVANPGSFIFRTLPPYRGRYTLVVFYRNFWWNLVGKPEVRCFTINGDPFDDSFIIGGREVFGDKFIKLSKRKAYKKTFFRLDFEVALRDYVPW